MTHRFAARFEALGRIYVPTLAPGLDLGDDPFNYSSGIGLGGRAYIDPAARWLWIGGQITGELANVHVDGSGNYGGRGFSVAALAGVRKDLGHATLFASIGGEYLQMDANDQGIMNMRKFSPVINLGIGINFR